MIWVLEIISCVWFGFEVVVLLSHQFFDCLQCFAVGIPVGICSFSWVMIFWSYFVPMNIWQGKIAVVLFFAVSIMLRIYNNRYQLEMVFRFDYYQQWTLIFSVFFFFLIMYSSMLMGGLSTKGAAYSDLPFHLNIITSLSHGINYHRKGLLTCEMTIYGGVQLAYPIIPDFFSAALVSTGGATLRDSLFLPSLLLSYSLLMSLYAISRYYTGNSFSACLSILLFSCMGGLGWLTLLSPNALSEKNARYDFVHFWSDSQQEFWLQTIMHIIVPQRSALFAIPLCYWAIMSLLLSVHKCSLKMMVLAGLLVGLTPQVQAHAFVAMAQWSIVFCLVSFSWNGEWKKEFFRWVIFALLANLIALPQLSPFFGRVKDNSESFITFDPVWNDPSRGKGILVPFRLWWRGLGIFGGIAFWAGFSTATKMQILVYIPSLVVWAIGNLIRYQMWEYDNIKVFFDAWVPIAVPFVSQYLVFFFRQSKRNKNRDFSIVVFVLFTFLSIFSGILCILLYLGSPTDIYTEEQVKFGEWIAENTNTTGRFLAFSSTEQPVASIGGRSIFMGYEGWVVSHGLEYNNRRMTRNNLFTSPENRELFLSNFIQYVVEDFGNSTFSAENVTHWNPIFYNDFHRVWKLI